MESITDGTSTFTPEVVDGYESSSESENVVHQVIGGGIDVTLRPAGPRAGTLSLVFASESDAAGCEAMHRTASTFTLTSDDRPTVNMTYVLDGSCSRALDDATREVWIVSVGFREVT